MTLKDKLNRPVGAQYATEKEWRNNSRIKRQSQSKNNTQLRMLLVMEVKSHAVKSNITQEHGMLGP